MFSNPPTVKLLKLRKPSTSTSLFCDLRYILSPPSPPLNSPLRPSDTLHLSGKRRVWNNKQPCCRGLSYAAFPLGRSLDSFSVILPRYDLRLRYLPLILIYHANGLLTSHSLFSQQNANACRVLDPFIRRCRKCELSVLLDPHGDCCHLGHHWINCLVLPHLWAGSVCYDTC